nr:PREDICTED: WD repeat-containing protein 18 [Lepisosteus oculatus]
MAAPMEVVVCADSSGQLWNCAVYELHSWTNLLTYRGGNTSPRTLAVLNGEYILGAQLGKNYISVWEVQRKDQLQQKIVCPGVVTCLTASPNGLYLLAGIAEAIYLWEVRITCLVRVLPKVTVHYRECRCSHFSNTSSDKLSGEQRHLSALWNLASVVQVDPLRTPEPRHVWAQHSLPITDIHCGLMGPQARVATASLDQTVKLWEISSGEMLLSVLFDVGIMSVTFDPCEYSLFCGGSDGSIFQVSLYSSNLSRDKAFQPDSEGNQVFKGHRNLVTCLSVSMDGTLLLSGSHDETVRLWDIQSKQSLRTLNHKGPVTNAFIMPAPANMFLPDGRPSVPLPRFSRHLNTTEQGEGPEAGGVSLRLGLHTQGSEESYLEKAEKLYSMMCAITDKRVFGDGENTKVRVAELEEEVKTLKKINKDLYEFSSQLLTKPS